MKKGKGYGVVTGFGIGFGIGVGIGFGIGLGAGTGITLPPKNKLGIMSTIISSMIIQLLPIPPQP